MGYSREEAIRHMSSEVRGFAKVLEASVKDDALYVKEGREALAALGVSEEELIEHYDSED
jgi:hypothetical protein